MNQSRRTSARPDGIHFCRPCGNQTLQLSQPIMNPNCNKPPSIPMKTRVSKSVRFLSILGLALWAATPEAVAQTSAQLAIQTCAGLTITGAVGSVYSIEYVT